jgi:hypothetical protein
MEKNIFNATKQIINNKYQIVNIQQSIFNNQVLDPNTPLQTTPFAYSVCRFLYKPLLLQQHRAGYNG